jgi:hypothetical protein
MLVLTATSKCAPRVRVECEGEHTVGVLEATSLCASGVRAGK